MRHRTRHAPLLLGLVGLLAAPDARAEDAPAWYSADAVASQSKRFGEAGRAVGPAWDDASRRLRVLGLAAESLEIAVGLAGDRLPDTARARAEEVRKRITAAHLSTQRHVDLLGDDYQQVFQAAVDRAIEVRGGGIEECVAEARRGGPAMPGMAPARPSCPGDDLSGELAEAVDGDAELATELAAIADVPWPEVQVEAAPQPVLPLTGTERYVRLAPVARGLVGTRLDLIVDALDRRLADIAPDGNLAADEATLAEARDARAEYEQALAALGDRLFVGLADIAERRTLKDVPDLGVCTNPEVLGGCPGEDVTDAVLPLLRADRKLNRDLARP